MGIPHLPPTVAAADEIVNLSHGPGTVKGDHGNYVLDPLGMELL